MRLVSYFLCYLAGCFIGVKIYPEPREKIVVEERLVFVEMTKEEPEPESLDDLFGSME